MDEAQGGRLAHLLGHRGLVWVVVVQESWGWGAVRQATCRRCGAVPTSYRGQVYERAFGPYRGSLHDIIRAWREAGTRVQWKPRRVV